MFIKHEVCILACLQPLSFRMYLSLAVFLDSSHFLTSQDLFLLRNLSSFMDFPLLTNYIRGHKEANYPVCFKHKFIVSKI